MVAAMAALAVQDGLSKKLAASYTPVFFIMIRYWAFAAFVLAVAAGGPGGIRRAAATRRPMLQIARGLLLAAEVVVMVWAFALIGLAQSLAIFACYPLIVTALSGPILGERVGAAGWAAVAAGFLGVLILLGGPRFEPTGFGAALALLSAAMFALYSVLTRLAARDEPASVSFFYSGVAGAAGLTLVGPFQWATPDASGWFWIGALCVVATFAHWLLIRAYAAAPAARLQPLSYLQIVFGVAIGALVFGEELTSAMITGGAITLAAGLVALRLTRDPADAPPPK